MFRKFDLSLGVAVGVIIGLVGCGTNDINNVEIPIVEAEKTEQEKITSALPAQAVTDVSPASTLFQLPGADAAPDEVAQKFFEFLNNEDQENFELLLTPVALNAVSRMDFKLPPVADPNSKIECTPPSYATIRQKICFVACKGETKDPAPHSAMSLMLRKSNSGWRVAGMMIAGEKPGQQNLLSFESLADLNQIKESVQFVDAIQTAE